MKKLLCFLLFYPFYIWCELPQPPATAPEQKESINTADIKLYLDGDEIIELQAGGDTVLALLREEMTGQPKGTAIIIPDWSQTATSPRGIQHLRVALNHIGWTTMTLSVPDPLHVLDVKVKPPQGESKVQFLPPPSSYPLTDEQLSTYKTSLYVRIDAALKKAFTYPGFFVLIGQGTNGAFINELIKEDKIQEIDGVVMLSAYMPDPTRQKQLAQAIAEHEIPVLDIYQSYDNAKVLAELSLRRDLTKKKYKAQYRQRELFGYTNYAFQNERLFKEVYGWFTFLGM
ncbi:DUF3530 family protein [Algicola sagamiensis]|uniref:DUF3530 family protein n=1 Tax=Algicola sagamiensis TaxID=163869 RepID=UPI000363BF61|nr:DUF3530 family protein [Algicola sagamiensis]